MKIKLPPMPTTSQLFWGIFSAALLAFAVWLVSPFIKIEPADYLRAGQLALRLGGGLLIFMIYAGKWSFDIFAPQGLAKRVSGLKSAGLIVFDLLLVAFMIFIVAQAATLFLQQGISQDEQNLSPITSSRLETSSLVQLALSRIKGA